jgi:hypothetical protein
MRGETDHYGEDGMHEGFVGGVKLGLCDSILKQICENFVVLRVDTPNANTSTTIPKPFL